MSKIHLSHFAAMLSAADQEEAADAVLEEDADEQRAESEEQIMDQIITLIQDGKKRGA